MDEHLINVLKVCEKKRSSLLIRDKCDQSLIKDGLYTKLKLLIKLGNVRTDLMPKIDMST